MKILVVGSTGLIGSYVAKELEKHGEVLGVSRSTPISVDVKDPASIKAMYEKVGRVDAVASCIGKVAFKNESMERIKSFRVLQQLHATLARNFTLLGSKL